tara:strand:+ start:3933 stop:4898 length:966 start_codon:yes stop_codon:yes gene_type:complete
MEPTKYLKVANGTGFLPPKTNSRGELNFYCDSWVEAVCANIIGRDNLVAAEKMGLNLITNFLNKVMSSSSKDLEFFSSLKTPCQIRVELYGEKLGSVTLRPERVDSPNPILILRGHEDLALRQGKLFFPLNGRRTKCPRRAAKIFMKYFRDDTPSEYADTALTAFSLQLRTATNKARAITTRCWRDLEEPLLEYLLMDIPKVLSLVPLDKQDDFPQLKDLVSALQGSRGVQDFQKHLTAGDAHVVLQLPKKYMTFIYTGQRSSKEAKDVIYYAHEDLPKELAGPVTMLTMFPGDYARVNNVGIKVNDKYFVVFKKENDDER